MSGQHTPRSGSSRPAPISNLPNRKTASDSSRTFEIARREIAESELGALRHEVTMLTQMLESLHAEFAAFRAAMMPTATSSSDDPTATPVAAEAPTPSASANTTSTSRRALLTWSGLGAAAALAAAGGAALTSQTAHASNGGDLVLGADNTAEQQTTLRFDGTQTSTIALFVNASNASSTTGVDGLSGTNGIGVLGQSHGGAGTGVFGESDSGNGVVGFSTFGPSIVAGGAGRLQQVLTPFTGPPTSGSYTIGEQVRDTNGDFFICVVSGSPGTWRKVAAGAPGVSGAITFLANPIRLLDTRSGSPWIGNSTHSLQVTGVSVGGLKVPTGAVGVVGNVTVVRATGSGDLRLYPGATAPLTSTINFTAGQVIANGVTIGLSGSGKLNIRVDMPSNFNINVLFDASGYIL